MPTLLFRRAAASNCKGRLASPGVARDDARRTRPRGAGHHGADVADGLHPPGVREGVHEPPVARVAAVERDLAAWPAELLRALRRDGGLLPVLPVLRRQPVRP